MIRLLGVTSSRLQSTNRISKATDLGTLVKTLCFQICAQVHFSHFARQHIGSNMNSLFKFTFNRKWVSLSLLFTWHHFAYYYKCNANTHSSFKEKVG
jgi:hypothetical protein